MIDWLFRDRRSGRIVVGQFPNAPLWLFLATVVGRWLVDEGSTAHAALRGVTVINNPFMWSADDKFFGATLATTLGIASPRTALLPNKEYIPGIKHDESLRNLVFPLDWKAAVDYVGMPLVLKDAYGGGWRDVYVCHTMDDLLRHYDTSGRLTVPATGEFTIPGGLGGWVPQQITDATTNPPTSVANGAEANLAGVTVSFADMTQFNAVSAVTSQKQDGYATGQLSGLNIDENGNMFAAFTNGQSKLIGQVMLVNFSNPQGLKPVGGTAWVETYASGVPIEGMAKSGTFGAIQAGALEESNVDLTAQLVQLIKAQSNYQANAKTVTTQTTVMQTTINMT